MDSPEISAAVIQSGQIHPPGHPVYQALHSLARWLPVGTLNFRIAFFSALTLALCAGMLTRLATHMSWPGLNSSSRRDPTVEPMSSAQWLVVFFSVLAVIVPGVLEQGVRVEVYALHILLTLCTLDLLLGLRKCASRSLRWLALGILLGLGGANHHYLTVLCLVPATLWVLVSSGEHRVRKIGLVFLGGIVGLIPYLALVVRDPGASGLFWSDTQSLTGFWDMITAAAFQGSVTDQEHGSLLSNLQLAFGMVLQFVGPVVFILGLVGLAWAASARLAGLGVVLLVIMGSLTSKSLMYMDPTNPDDRGYLSVAFVLWAWMGGFVLCKVLKMAQQSDLGSSYSRVGVHLVAVALLIATGFSSVTLARQDRPGAQEFMRVIASEIPSNALALTYYHQSYFLAHYGQVIDGRRPDVTQAHISLGGMRANNPHRLAFRAHNPRWATLADAYDQEGGFPVRHLSQAAGDSPVVFEPAPSLTGLPVERTTLGAFFAQIHKEAVVRSCLPGPLQARYGAFGSTRGTTGLSAAIGFTLMNQTMFHFRTGNLGCAKVAHDLLKQLAGQERGRLDPYFQQCGLTTQQITNPTRAMRGFPNPFSPETSLPDPEVVCPSR